jgi:hypothetical protein
VLAATARLARRRIDFQPPHTARIPNPAAG